MKKRIDDYKHLYYPIELIDDKLPLRPLSDMTEEEAHHVAWLSMNSERHLDEESWIEKEEVQTEFHPNDGGNFVDANVAGVVDVSCRCWEGQLSIFPNGDIHVFDYDGQHEKPGVERIAEIVVYYLKHGFDLFGLIESGLAIDKSITPSGKTNK